MLLFFPPAWWLESLSTYDKYCTCLPVYLRDSLMACEMWSAKNKRKLKLLPLYPWLFLPPRRRTCLLYSSTCKGGVTRLRPVPNFKVLSKRMSCTCSTSRTHKMKRIKTFGVSGGSRAHDNLSVRPRRRLRRRDNTYILYT